MKTGYYTIKSTFKEFDPEGKGIVSRYAFDAIFNSIITCKK